MNCDPGSCYVELELSQTSHPVRKRKRLNFLGFIRSRVHCVSQVFDLLYTLDDNYNSKTLKCYS